MAWRGVAGGAVQPRPPADAGARRHARVCADHRRRAARRSAAVSTSSESGSRRRSPNRPRASDCPAAAGRNADRAPTRSASPAGPASAPRHMRAVPSSRGAGSCAWPRSSSTSASWRTASTRGTRQPTPVLAAKPWASPWKNPGIGCAIDLVTTVAPLAVRIRWVWQMMPPASGSAATTAPRPSSAQAHAAASLIAARGRRSW